MKRRRCTDLLAPPDEKEVDGGCEEECEKEVC